MKKNGRRYPWFKLSLAAGSLLGLLLLIQTIISYYQVSTNVVTSELRKEAQQQLTLLEREARRLSIRDPVDNPADLIPLLDELRQESPKKIAWIKVIDWGGRTLAQSGDSVGSPFGADRLRVVYQVGGAASEIRETPGGKVLVSVHSVRLLRRAGSNAGQPDAERESGPRPNARFVEMALYWNSASETFVTLRTDLIVGVLASLGLVLSMVLMWSRFPHYLHGKKLEQQTELARLVQTELLPAPDATFAAIDFAACSVPAAEVGGDFYDAFSAAGGRVAMVLGDVSGKGLPAAVVVGLLLGAARSSNWLDGAAEHEASTARLSELLRERTSLDRFATLFWCYYEPRTRLLRYVNAGHPPPVVARRNEQRELQIERLREGGGPILGVVPNARYQQAELHLCPGDLVVLFSDGVVEAARAGSETGDNEDSEPSEEQFGDERLLQIIRDNFDRSSTQIRDEILKGVRSFLGGERNEDDLTLVVARVQQGTTQA